MPSRSRPRARASASASKPAATTPSFSSAIPGRASRRPISSASSSAISRSARRAGTATARISASASGSPDETSRRSAGQSVPRTVAPTDSSCGSRFHSRLARVSPDQTQLCLMRLCGPHVRVPKYRTLEIEVWMDLAKLILALESATEGSEYLDYAIQRRFGLKKPVPAYTSSMDAALTLVPPEWSIHKLHRRNDCRGTFTGWVAELYRATDVVLEFPSNGTAAAAPLALCAATMRVLHALEGAQAGTGKNAARHPPAMRVANGGVLLRRL